MNKIFLLLTLIIPILVTGCASPRYSGSSISPNVLEKNLEIVSINDNETRDGFQTAVEKWLTANGYTYVVKPEYSKYDPEKITIEYVGHWRWDIALYLAFSEIEAIYKGQTLSKVTFRAPNSLNTNKWGDAEERIRLMLDILFGKITANEATDKL